MNVTEAAVRASTQNIKLIDKNNQNDMFPTHEVGLLLLITCLLMLWSKYYCMAGKSKINKIKSKEYEDI